MSNRALTLMMGFVAVLILAVGGVFVVILATGGSGDDDGGGSDRPSEGSTPGKSSSSGGICNGDKLITFGSDPASVLDPIQVRDEGTSEYVVEIFGGLVTLDLDLKVVPDIAKEWKVSDGGKTYTFKLRDDVVFHNSNRRVTANDFKYSIERAADPANGSPTVTLYLSNIVGIKERFSNKATDVSGVKVIDETTLEIRVNQPSEYFLAELTYPVAFVVDKDQVQKNPRNWTQKPNGTGPFRLVEFTPAERIRLARNDRYHLGAAKVSEVVFELGGGSILTRYENNELHIGGVPGIELEAVKGGNSPLSKEYRPQPRMSVSYLAFNVRKPPFDDLKVRQAMAMSVDKERINQVLFFDSQRVADGILPPDMPGYTESVSAYAFNPDKAKQTLGESKYAGKMPRIVLTYAGQGGDAPDVLTAITAGWKEILGLDVELQASEYSAFLRELRRGTFQMFSAGWAADYPDPEDFIDKLFHSESVQNEQGYSNPEVDKILLQARSESNQQKRFALYAQAEQMILDDAAVIPDFWPVEHLLVKPCVKNWPSVSMNVPRYRYIEIAATEN
ncbi:MAG: peptide ABC transporter substrate-binding protein [Dehalococcoidia bacterium]|nr:peptide ABC transporter substrate-binding protein [Dehalococcoidia bacterium]